MSQATLGSEPYRNSNLFSGYYLDERVDDLEGWEADEDAEAAFEVLRELWEVEGKLVSSYGEDELLDQWIGEVLRVLGFDTISEGTLPDGGGYVDRLLFESEEERRGAAERKLKDDHEGMFSRASALLEAKQWDHDFEKRFSEQRSYRDASHQVKYYLERTPGDLQWGVLTDGKKWRLYGTKDYETQTYYEVDLPELLESGDLEQFKYFYCFFRPEAFEEIGGTSFLETVWTESETAAQELGEDLQDNVFTALRVLGKGFVDNNDLGIDPADEDARDELKDQSLVLLYRLMFVLYAESRGLIDPDDHEANAEYHEYFSLEKVRGQIIDKVEGRDVESSEAFHDEFSEYATDIWNRLSRLFELIDEGEDDLDIPPYNGGLFDHDDHEFLADNEVTDPIIAEVIFRLSTTENEEGEYVPADYADLDTRHLGSIYEGLLEHEFRIAPDEGMAAVSKDGAQVWKPASDVSVADAVEVVDGGGLYVVNDEGERKATGAYYTPDYVVTYIVEETVDPLIEEIHEDLEADDLDRSDTEYFRRFYDRVTDLTILDPAMGSGHFLTKATGYLTEQVMEVIREQEIQSYDEQAIRREISKEAIYGVDLNGMAVELAKLSMWLETLAADQPLAFLDHHLKEGNSLVGSDITEVLSDDAGIDGEDGQITLTQAFARVRQDTLEHVMELMSDLLAYDNETLEDVKSMEELYEEIRDDPLYGRLFELSNVHTAERFGAEVPDGAYEKMAGAIEDRDDWSKITQQDWFISAQATAEEGDFFHWELEFPEVFFDRNGEKMPEAGFDAVIGNPPWGHPGEDKDYLKEKYSKIVKRLPDNFSYFAFKSLNLCKEDSNYGVILPSVVLFQSEYSKLRGELIEADLFEVVDLGEGVFEDAVAPSAILICTPGTNRTSIKIRNLRGTAQEDLIQSEEDSIDFPVEDVVDEDDSVIPTYKLEVRKLLAKLQNKHGRLGERFAVEQGIQTGGDEAFTVTDEEIEEYDLEQEYIHPVLFGSDVTPFAVSEPERSILYIARDIKEDQIPNIVQYLEQYRESLDSVSEVKKGIRPWYTLHRPRNPEMFEQNNILLRQTGDTLIAGLCREDTYTVDSLLCVTPSGNYTDLESLTLFLNSNLLRGLYDSITQEKGRVFSQVKPQNVQKLPLPSYDSVQSALQDLSLERSSVGEISLEGNDLTEVLSDIHSSRSELGSKRASLNLTLLDYLGNYDEGPRLPDIGFFQPSESNILDNTTEDLSKLRVGDVKTVRDGSNVTIYATARYKPENEDAFETDRWGYTETDHHEAFYLTDLSTVEATLVEEFVPIAAEKADGFAGFRDNATKTNSPLDRLKEITLPDPDDVSEDLERFINAKKRAEKLDEEIEKTDQLIDEIVYDLYDLTDEEIEIVESAVTDD